ncbi:hypothetical protein [Dickeya aquatica]|uniref:hypothetical protein n=1 Tax=Dickeya aquatica TaxID=1401087 RepID=UPI001E3AD1D7|nr:hypothetical protein [Dickeya aquatica]
MSNIDRLIGMPCDLNSPEDSGSLYDVAKGDVAGANADPIRFVTIKDHIVRGARNAIIDRYR